jgi:hypothetical protein
MDYYKKYLKYKQKYLQLQKMIGGNNTNLIELACDPEDEIVQCIEKDIKRIDGYDGDNRDLKQRGVYINSRKIDESRPFANYSITKDTNFDLRIGPK